MSALREQRCRHGELLGTCDWCKPRQPQGRAQQLVLIGGPRGSLASTSQLDIVHYADCGLLSGHTDEPGQEWPRLPITRAAYEAAVRAGTARGCRGCGP